MGKKAKITEVVETVFKTEKLINLVYAYVINNNPKSYTEVVAALKDYKPASVKRTYFTVLAEIKKTEAIVEATLEETSPSIKKDVWMVVAVVAIVLVSYEIITKLI